VLNLDVVLWIFLRTEPSPWAGDARSAGNIDCREKTRAGDRAHRCGIIVICRIARM